MASQLTSLASSIYAQVRTDLGDAWGELSAEEKSLVAQCTTDAASLAIEAAASDAGDASAQQQLIREKAQIQAQTDNIEACAKTVISDAIWKAVNDALSKGIALAIAKA